jgi:hypothetical protein
MLHQRFARGVDLDPRRRLALAAGDFGTALERVGHGSRRIDQNDPHDDLDRRAPGRNPTSTRKYDERHKQDEGEEAAMKKHQGL